MTSKRGNEITEIVSLTQLLDNWPFFVEGLRALNDPRRANMNTDAEEFLKYMTKILALRGTKEGLIIMARSKSGTPLGFGAGYNATGMFSKQRVFFVYAVYANGLDKFVMQDLMEWCRQYTIDNNYDEIQAMTSRLSTAARRWFIQTMGFERKCVIYRKAV